MTVGLRKDGIDREAYIAESLRIWRANPEMTKGELRKRRQHFHDATWDQIVARGLGHEKMTFSKHNGRRLSR